VAIKDRAFMGIGLFWVVLIGTGLGVGVVTGSGLLGALVGAVAAFLFLGFFSGRGDDADR
jgi:hypothetical protein